MLIFVEKCIKLQEGALIIMSIGLFAGCSDYGYNFHYSVIDGNGEITIEDEALLRKVDMCNETPRCELECPDNSYVISRLGGKKGRHKLTFVAMPDEGYQVKEWLFNGEVVEGNKTNSYEAIVLSEQNYNGVISVRFEAIQG